MHIFSFADPMDAYFMVAGSMVAGTMNAYFMAAGSKVVGPMDAYCMNAGAVKFILFEGSPHY